MCPGVSFITKVQPSWIKSNFYFQILPRTGFFSEIYKIFNSTFENTNNSVKYLRNRWQSFMAVKSISKRKYENKNSIKSQLVRYMCHADTCVSHEIKDVQVLQFYLQLADTVCAKKLFTNQRHLLFRKLCKISLILENLLLLCLYFRQSR